MAKITYQGDADAIEWHGVEFKKGKAVETDNEALIAKAQRNRFFKTVAMVDKQTKEEIEAEEKARKESEEQREREEEAERERILALNAGEPLTDEAEGDEAKAEEPPAPRRGRPRNS